MMMWVLNYFNPKYINPKYINSLLLLSKLSSRLRSNSTENAIRTRISSSMKAFPTATTLLLASIPSLTSAAPTQIEERQQPGVIITFSGAGPSPPSYTLSPPFDGRNITISMSFASICCSIFLQCLLFHTSISVYHTTVKRSTS